MTALRPTPPAPITTTDSPAWTFAVFRTAPIPVVTAQPISAAISGASRVDLDRRRCRYDLPLTERADPAVGADRVAVGAAQPDELGRQPMTAAIGSRAQPRFVARDSWRTSRTARSRRARPDRLAPRSLTPSPSSSTHAAPSWPITTSARPLPLAVHDVQVGVTDARGRHPDPDLASLRRVERQLLDPWLRPGTAEDDAPRADRLAFHAADPSARMPKGGPYGPPYGI